MKDRVSVQVTPEGKLIISAEVDNTDENIDEVISLILEGSGWMDTLEDRELH